MVPLRISLAILSKRFGGAERHVLDLANRLAARPELTVQLIVRRHGWLQASGPGHALDECIRVDWVSPILKRWGLRRALKAFGPAVVHSHLGMTSRLVGKLGLGVPIVATLHGRFKAKDYSRHDALICVAPWQQDGIPRNYRGEVRVIPNFLEESAPPVEARAAIRRAYAIPEDAFVIGGVGRFAPEKGFDTLLEAFRLAGVPDARLLLVGDGPEMPALRAQAPHGVIFAGWQDAPAPYYAAFDLFVSASRDEPFGLALLQAMQTGLPIVATAADGPQWLLNEGAGLLVDIDDAAVMAQAIRKLAEDEALRQRLGASAKTKSARFRPDEVVAEIIALYRRLAEATSATRRSSRPRTAG